MRIRITTCLPAAITLAGAALLLASGGAFSQAFLPGGPAVPGTELVLVGTPADESEKDSIGFAVPPPAACVAPRFSERPQSVGPVTGDPEKDNFGFVVLGGEPCPTAPRLH